jgi:membrane protein
MIPITLLLLTLMGQYLYSSREILNHITYHLQNVVPSIDPESMRSVMRIIRHRKIVGVLGVGGLIWSSTWVFSSLRTVLNSVFEIEKDRKFLRGKGIDLFMVFSGGMFLLMSMMLTSAITFIQGSHIGPFLDMRPIIRFILRYLIPFFFTFWMSCLIYKFIPNKRIHLKSAFKAAFFTSLMWEIAKQLFGWYVLHVGRLSMVYGSLSTLAIFFLLVYYSSAILILGGEVLCLIEKKRKDPVFWVNKG